jgi:hypothetical protein
VNLPAGYHYTLAPTGSAYTFTPALFAFPALSAPYCTVSVPGTTAAWYE